MTVSAAVPKTAPVMIAWEAFKVTEEYANAARWALKEQHTEGSLWHAFYTGFYACAVNNATQAPQDVAGLVEGIARIVDPSAFANGHFASAERALAKAEAILAALRPSPISHESKEPVVDLEAWRWANEQIERQVQIEANVHVPAPRGDDERFKAILERKGYCYECGHELHNRVCPACNPEMVDPLELAAADNNHKALVEVLQEIKARAEEEGGNPYGDAAARALAAFQSRQEGKAS